MAKLQKKENKSNADDWLATYGDMVTLLLTFFVLLYASSNLDEQKFQYIFQAFQSTGKYLNDYVDYPEHTDDEGSYVVDEEPAQSGGDGTQPQSFDTLYQYLSDYSETEVAEGVMSVSKDGAHIFIRFNSSVFFEGNSAVLTDAGREIINDISPAIKAVKNSIQRMTVTGHTAQGISAVNDWDLSAGRAVSVAKYMEFRHVLDSKQFRVAGSGPHEPIADNSTEEGRAQNRRVELVLLRNDLDTLDSEVIKDILRGDYGIDVDQIDPNKPDDKPTKLPDGSVEGIIDSIESLFPNASGSGSSVGGGSGPFFFEDEFESFIKTEESVAESTAASE